MKIIAGFTWMNVIVAPNMKESSPSPPKIFSLFMLTGLFLVYLKLTPLD